MAEASHSSPVRRGRWRAAPEGASAAEAPLSGFAVSPPAAQGERWRLDRSVSVAILVALGVQAAGALLWAGRAEARMDDLKQQLDRQQPVAERLARLEEQALSTRAAIDRIEAKLDGRH